jgi:hypothetical protein
LNDRPDLPWSGRRLSDDMRLPSPLIVPNVTLCLTAFLAALWAASADAQVRRGPVQYESVTTVTSADAGFIEGTVKDEAG